MAKVGVILNPHAGGVRSGVAPKEAFEHALGEEGWVFETKTLADLDRAAEFLVGEGIDVLAVRGGDGSFFRALSACLKRDRGSLRSFLPLPAGSMNTIATSLGWRARDPVAAVASAARPTSEADFRVVDREVIRINDEHYGFMVGAGVIVSFLRAYYEAPGRGPIAAARVAGRFIASVAARSDFARELFASFEAAVDCGGQPLPWNTYTVVYAATVTELGLGFRIAHRAGTSPGKFHVLAGNPPIGPLIWKLPHAKFGWPLQAQGLFDDLASQVEVRFESPTRFMIDGDILPPADGLSLAVGPTLRILL